MDDFYFKNWYIFYLDNKILEILKESKKVKNEENKKKKILKRINEYNGLFLK